MLTISPKLSWLLGFPGHRSENRPTAFFFIVLVWNRPFDHQNEGSQTALGGKVEMPQKIIPVLMSEEGIVKMHLGYPGHRSEDNIFKARLRRCGHGNRVPITPKTSRYPENVDWVLCAA